MVAEEFSKLLKKGNLASFYIFAGEEKSRILRCIKAIKSYKEVKVSSIDTLVKMYISNDIFGDRKLLIYEGEDLCEQTLSILQQESRNMAIIIMKSIDKRKKIYKTLTNVVEFGKMSESGLTRVLDDALGVELDPNLVNKVITRCSGDLGRVENEGKKLRNLVDLGVPITKEVIEEQIAPTSEEVAFDLVNAIVTRDKVRAIHLINELHITKENPVVILLLLYRQFRNILIIQGYKDETPKEIAMKTGLSVGLIYAIKGNIGRFSMSQLGKILELIYEADTKIKKGQLDMTIGLDLVAIKILAM